MEFLEDYLSEKMIDDLTFEIAKVLDDDKYIDSTLSAFDNDEEATQLLNFIRNHPNITRADIDLKTIEIYNASHNIKRRNGRMAKEAILDGTYEEQIACLKEFFGLSPEQDFSDLPDD